MKKIAMVALLMCSATAASAEDIEYELRATQERLQTAASGGRDALSSAYMCLLGIRTALDSGVPETHRITLQQSAGSLKAGDHSLSEIYAECQLLQGRERAKELPRLGEQLLDVIATMTDSDSTQTLESFTRNCHEFVDSALKAGANPSNAIEIAKYGHKGTLETAHDDLCGKGDGKLKEIRAAQLGPYKGVLKNDKWRLIQESPTAGYFLPEARGATSTDPKLLAKAKVWFDILTWDPRPDDKCYRDKMWLYRRYQFDGAHKLVKTTEKKYCGQPGVQALR